MKMTKIEEEFFDNSIRAESIVHIGTQCLDDYSWSDAAEEAFQQDFERVWPALGIHPPEEDEDELWAISEHLKDHNKSGFLVQFAAPIPKFMDSDSYTCSWGYYTTEWIYAETYDAVCEKAIKWRKEYLEKEKLKAA